jgi:aryl-alcohol dehydrogenase-like predicted oxidoreductase
MNRLIGQTGIEVFPIGLGAMPMSISGRPSEKQSIETIHAALDAGVNFIDTADVYCLDDSDIGHNERLIAKAVAALGNPHGVLVATKGGLRRPGGSWTRDGSPEHLRQACEMSLKALKVDRIFLYQLHAPDTRVPLEASLDALGKLQREGKIEHIGLSNVDAGELKRAQRLVRVASVQNRANVADQADIETGFVDTCGRQNVTYLAYSPVGGGYGHRQLTSLPLLKKLASEYQVSPYCVALAWLLSKDENVLPIPGASKPSSITDSAQAAALTLDRRHIAEIDRLRFR